MFKRVCILTIALALLLAALPAHAQEADTVTLRFANFVLTGTWVSFSGNGGDTLAEITEYGVISDPITIPADLKGLGYAVTGFDWSNGGARGSSDPIVTPGHDYLILLLGDQEEQEPLMLDLTLAFGEVEGAAADFGRVLIAQFVPNLATGIYTISSGEGSPYAVQFLSQDIEDPEPQQAAFALPAGDYQVQLTTGAAPTTPLFIEGVQLSLSAGQTKLVVLVGMVDGAPNALQIAIADLPAE